MRRLLTSLALITLGGLPVCASAGTEGHFPGGAADSRTLKVQEKVDELFEAGEYERAQFIYKNELAPIGDKYAQYMLGYMHLTGTGVEEDPLLASAWYRLAAERGNDKFSAVRDQLLNSFDEIDRVRSDELFRDLLAEYSDAVILLRLIRSDLGKLEQRTGTRLVGGSDPVTVYDPRTGDSVGPDYYRDIERRLTARLGYLNAILGEPDRDVRDPREVDLAELEQRVERYIETTSDR